MAKPEDEARKALLERAQVLLSTDASPAAKKNLKSGLDGLAATLLLEWLVGDKRFEGQSQQTEYWLSRFYEEIFVDEQVRTIIRPETLVCWHRAGFGCYWRWKSRQQGGRPPIDTELCDAAFSICRYNVGADDDCQEVYA